MKIAHSNHELVMHCHEYVNNYTYRAYVLKMCPKIGSTNIESTANLSMHITLTF